MNIYKTIQEESESLYKDKGSKFLGYAFPVASEEQINQALDKIRSLHPKATHHCYAYVIGLEETVRKANDDGEPSNSAGKPILGQIDSHNLHNALLIIVRYYGGTKLGVGGLQTAYKAAAQLAIEANIIIEKEIPVYYELNFPYVKQGIIDHLLKTTNGSILDKEFMNNCYYKCQVPKAASQQFLDKIKLDRTISIKES